MAGVIERFSIINHQQSGSESDGQIWICQDSVHTPSLYSHRAEGRNCMHLCICVYVYTYVRTYIPAFVFLPSLNIITKHAREASKQASMGKVLCYSRVLGERGDKKRRMGK